MNISFRYYLFLLFLTLSSVGSITCVYGSDYIFSTIGLAEGIAHPTVKSVLRDSKDYLWIGTKSGLNRYDKGNIVSYKRNPALNNTLPDNDILDIFEDGLGTVWVITATGVASYDRTKDVFLKTEVEGKPLRARSYIVVPTGVWFGGAGTLFFYDYETGEIKDKQIKGGSEKYYTAIHPWGRDRYLLATRWDGMWVYNSKSNEIEPFNLFDGKRVLATYIDSDSDLWISEYGTGLKHIDRKGNLTNVRPEGIDEKSIILDIIESEGSLLLATDGQGVFSYDKTTGEIKNLDTQEGSPGQLRSVNRLYKDRYDNIYAGTVRGGLITVRSTPFKTLKPPSDYDAFSVTSLVADHNKVWTGVDGSGILLYEPDRNDTFTPMKETDGLKIVSLDNFDDNRLLVSTYDSGIFLFDKTTGKIQPAPKWLQLISEENRNNGIPIDIHRLSADRIALVADKIYISDLSGSRVSVLEPGGKSTRLRIFYSDMGSLMCYNEQEVYNVDLDEETLTSLFKVKDENIECAVYDGKRNIYAGTSSGIKRYDFDTGEVSMAEARSRMPVGSGVTSLAINDDKLWIGALGQLFMRDLAKGGLTRFGAYDGVVPNEFIYKAVLSTPQYLLLGGVNGLMKISVNDIDEYSEQNPRQPLVLEEVIADGLPVAMNGKRARLPDNYSTLQLRFTGGITDPIRGEPVRIYIGHNKVNSVIETEDNTLTLGHLQASSGGRYDIYASIRDADGKWTEPGYMGQILVPVAWWRKPIAIVIICVLGAVAVALMLIYIWSRRRHNVMKRIEEHRRQSLEKEVGFLMNLNYELRTPLTLIYSRLKMLTDKVSKGEVPERKILDELNNIYRNTGKMRDVINTTVDLWRSGDMKTGEILETTDVAQWLEEILDELKPLIHDKKLTVDTEGVDDHLTMLCDLRRATIAMLNVLRSTISHAEEKTKITIKTGEEETDIKINISFYNDVSHGAGEELRYAGHLMALMDGDLQYKRYENGDPANIMVEFPKELKRQNISQNIAQQPDGEKDMEESEDFSKEENIRMLNMSDLTAIVVEDDNELRELLTESLSSIFGRVLEASNGKDALTYIKNSNPDLIITEARLPEMSGLELCRTIKKTKEYSHIPVIMLTTRLEELSIANGSNYGADNYLTKPFEIGVLEKRCVSVLKSFDRVRQWYKSQASDILPQDKRQSNDAEAFVLKVRDIIEQNINKPGFNVDDIVNQMLVSRSTLYGKFKEFTGQSLGNYINDYKLNRAKEMLSSTNMTMVDISDALGFTTQRYFSTFFKERTGVTPTAYRNNHNTENKES